MVDRTTTNAVLGTASNTLFKRYPLKSPAVQAELKFDNVNDVNNPKGSLEIWLSDFKAVDKISTSGNSAAMA